MVVPTPPPVDEASTPTPLTTGPLAASEGILNVNAVAGEPERPVGPAPAAVGKSVLVDAKIGDINGKPVYASKFLESRASKLKADAAEMSRKSPNWKAEWRRMAREDFKTGLDSMIKDELLRAEAIANFTPEQRVGFFTFMQNVADRLASENRGSYSAASRNLELTKGQTMEQYLREQEVRELVSFQLMKNVRSRVNVSWRDIRQAYEMHYDDFNKPPRAQFRLVQIANRNKAAIAEFQEALAAGNESFESLAQKPFNANSAKTGGLEEKTISGNRASATFYNNPELNAAAQTIQPGETAGPFVIGDFTSWIHLDKIVTETLSLYDAQIAIENALKGGRTRIESDRYLARLRSKATVSSVDEMAARLLAIAEERYLPRGK